MRLIELARLSLETFRTHRMRSFLTALGIIIGVMTVIAIVSLIQGMNYEVEKQISSLGSNTIFIQKFAFGMGRLDWDEINKRPNLTMDDALAIGQLPSIDKVAPSRSRTISKITWRGNKVTGAEVSGATPALSEVGNYQVETGRFINSDDSLRRHSVCVVGGYIVDNLFPYETPLGKRLVLDGKSYIIVGVLARKGSFLGQSQDNVIIVPITTFGKDFAPGRGIGEIQYSIAVGAMPKKGVALEKAIDEVRELMRRRHRLGYDKPDDFGISTQDTIRDIYRNITRVAFLVMIAVAAISLLVGGIGIMNIMLASVLERTREIGIRRAMGATRLDIRNQFLIEAIILSLLGGIIGILIGYGFTFAVTIYSDWETAISLWSVLLSFGVSSFVGILFGYFPAKNAAELDPIEALRYE